MSTFLTRLIDRARGTAPRVQPLIAPRFATGSGVPPRSEVTPAEARLEALPPSRPSGATPAAAPEKQGVEGQDIGHWTYGREAEVRTARAHDPGNSRRESSGATAPARTRPPELGHRGSPSPLQPLPSRAPVHPGDAAGGAAAVAPVVRVSIGRIEVRAAPASAAEPRPKGPANRPKLTLDAYLKSRAEGRR